MPKTLKIQNSPSRGLCCYLAVVHLIAAVAVLLISPGWLAIFVCLAGLLFSMHRGLCRYYRLAAASSIVNVIIQGERCMVQFVGGGSGEFWSRGKLGDQHLVSQRLVILQVYLKGKRSALWIPLCADAIEPESFRRLRVRLRLPVAGSKQSLAALKSY